MLLKGADCWLQDAFTVKPHEKSPLDANDSISLSHRGIFQPESRKNKVIFGFLFISNKYPLEFTSSLTKQQAAAVPVASA